MDERDQLHARVAELQGLNASLRQDLEAERRGERSTPDVGRYLDLADVIFLAIGPDRRVSYVNEKACSVLKLSRDKIIGRDWFETFIPERIRPELLIIFAKLASTAESSVRSGANAVLTGEGGERIVDWRTTVLRNEGGEFQTALCSGIDITDHERTHQIQDVLTHIANAVHVSEDQLELYETIRQQLGRVLSTHNFFIALYNDKDDTISLPYFVDEEDQEEFDSFPAGKTLTAYVIRRDTPVMLTREEADRWVEQGIVDVIGSPSEIWLGVPLRVRGKVIGAVVVQSYTNREEYDRTDLELLEFASGQIGLSIERKRTEEELQFLGTIPQQVTEAIIVTDENFVISYVNRATEELYGYASSELIGQSPDMLNAERMATRIQQDIYETVSSGGVWAGSHLNRRKDGSTFICELRISSLRNGEGGISSYISIMRNITERRRGEDLLRALNAAAVAMEQTMSRPEIFSAASSELGRIGCGTTVFLLDAGGRKATVSYASMGDRGLEFAEQLTGRSRETFAAAVDSLPELRQIVRDRRALLLDNASEAVAAFLPPGAKRHAAAIAQTYGCGRAIFAPMVVENRVVGVLSIGSPDLADGDIPTVVAFANLLTAAWRKATLMEELRESLRELRETQDQLLQAQKMEAIGNLAGGVAHDFNNLLTAITGYADLALAGLGADSDTHDEVSQIKKAAERAAALTRQLLAFSRRQPLQQKVVDLNSVVTNMEGLLRRLIGEDVELLTELDGEPRVKVDPGQIEQVITNLVVNARDAMPSGGSVTLRTDLVSISEADCEGLADAHPGHHVRLTVEDTGEGMEPETLDQIFEPFFSTKGPGKGTGLGLSVVYGIVKQHGGWIVATSEPGRGTAFRIHLPPTTENGMEERPAKEAERQEAGHGRRILLVEDEEAVRDFARTALTASGYEVTEAASAEDALRIFRESRGEFHLVFSDVVLPDESGIQLVERFIKERPDVPVLLSSGYTDQKSQWPIIRERGYRFLQKPYALPDLLGTVREIIESE